VCVISTARYIYIYMYTTTTFSEKTTKNMTTDGANHYVAYSITPNQPNKPPLPPEIDNKKCIVILPIRKIGFTLQ